MFAVIAAVLFGLLLVLELVDEDLGELGEILTDNALLYAGLLCLALHLAGVGSGGRRWWKPRR